MEDNKDSHKSKISRKSGSRCRRRETESVPLLVDDISATQESNVSCWNTNVQIQHSFDSSAGQTTNSMEGWLLNGSGGKNKSMKKSRGRKPANNNNRNYSSLSPVRTPSLQYPMKVYDLSHAPNDRISVLQDENQKTECSIPEDIIRAITSVYGPNVDLYRDVMELEEDPNSCTPATLRAAYFRQGRRVLQQQTQQGHVMDVHSSKNRFRAVHKAFEILTNPDWKDQYERNGLIRKVVADNDSGNCVTEINLDFKTKPCDHGKDNHHPILKRRSNSWGPSRGRTIRRLRWNEEVEELVFQPVLADEDNDENSLVEKVMILSCQSGDVELTQVAHMRKTKKQSHKPVIDIENIQDLNDQDLHENFKHDFFDDVEASLDGLSANLGNLFQKFTPALLGNNTRDPKDKDCEISIDKIEYKATQGRALNHDSKNDEDGRMRVQFEECRKEISYADLDETVASVEQLNSTIKTPVLVKDLVPRPFSKIDNKLIDPKDSTELFGTSKHPDRILNAVIESLSTDSRTIVQESIAPTGENKFSDAFDPFELNSVSEVSRCAFDESIVNEGADESSGFAQFNSAGNLDQTANPWLSTRFTDEMSENKNCIKSYDLPDDTSILASVVSNTSGTKGDAETNVVVTSKQGINTTTPDFQAISPETLPKPVSNNVTVPASRDPSVMERFSQNTDSPAATGLQSAMDTSSKDLMAVMGSGAHACNKVALQLQELFDEVSKQAEDVKKKAAESLKAISPTQNSQKYNSTAVSTPEAVQVAALHTEATESTGSLLVVLNSYMQSLSEDVGNLGKYLNSKVVEPNRSIVESLSVGIAEKDLDGMLHVLESELNKENQECIKKSFTY